MAKKEIKLQDLFEALKIHVFLFSLLECFEHLEQNKKKNSQQRRPPQPLPKPWSHLPVQCRRPHRRRVQRLLPPEPTTEVKKTWRPRPKMSKSSFRIKLVQIDLDQNHPKSCNESTFWSLTRPHLVRTTTANGFKHLMGTPGWSSRRSRKKKKKKKKRLENVKLWDTTFWFKIVEVKLDMSEL